MPWYSAIGLFKHKLSNPNAIPQYEERTVLVQAKSAKAAEQRILKEFAVYAKDAGVSYLKEYVFDDLILAPSSRVIEVACLRRVSHLSSREYIKRYWEDLRPVSCTKVGWKHAWHNKDGKHSACYNCQTIKKGQLWKKK